MAGRFKVVVNFPSGSRSRLMVWADGPEAAIASVKDFYEYALRTSSMTGIPMEATRVGDIPDQYDLNVTTDPKAVNHVAKNAKGEPVSTPSRPSAEAIVRATRELRTNQGALWVRLRQELRAFGVDPTAVAMIASVVSGDDRPPTLGGVVTREGRLVDYTLGEDDASGDARFELFAVSARFEAAEERLGRELLADGKLDGV